MRRSGLILALALLATPAVATAQMFSDISESPQNHQLEVKFGPYLPDIDGEGGVNAYSALFENDEMFMTRVEYDYQFWKEYGSLAVAIEIGYAQVTGNGFATGSLNRTSDETTLHIMPFTLALAYHFDVGAVRYDVPLVPYVKLGIDYYIWWITDGLGDTASFAVESQQTQSEVPVRDGAGDTWGWHVAVGVKILLDVLSPSTAQAFDVEVGVNNSYLFVELLYADVSDFGSDSSWQLGDMTVFGGVAFEF